jgi:hypothetical protein
MSRGPGRIERAIGDILGAELDNAFTAEELCERVYPGVPVEKKHRISVIRAVKKLAMHRSEIGRLTGDGLGSKFVFYRRDSVNSYAMARLKCDNGYRSHDPRLPYCRTNEAQLRRRLDDDRHRELMAPGGTWWLEVEIFTAERDGELEKAVRLKAERQSQVERVMERLIASLADRR